MSVFSERRVVLMKRNGMNQKKIAQKVGVSVGTMSFYARGKRMPSNDVLTRMAEVLNTSTGYLLSTSETIPAEQCEELQYLKRIQRIQQNLYKLNPDQLKKAENILRIAFDDVFDGDEK